MQIDDPCVSGTHCVLERRPNGSLVVRDRNSKNGTFVDGNPIEGAELRVGSYLSIGRTTLVAVAGAGSVTRPRALELLRGRDPVLRRAIEQGLRAAQTECSVLILGETGVGKDLFARAIHEGSRRSDGPFVAVNCGAIPRELIASELFGHEKGAFTGATEGRDGYFLEASGGTLFLDEIGELPIELQAHLLRILETRRVRRVGGSSERAVNVRIVAATNRMEGLGTESSRLRTDLYHRLATVVLALPPLRERMGDLPELVDAILDELTPDFGRKDLTDPAWAALRAYNWPGNVRELRQAVARAVTLGEDVLEADDFFPVGIGPHKKPEPTVAPEDDPTLAPYESIMKEAMQAALLEHGSIRGAALALGMPKSTFADRARLWRLSTARPARGTSPRRRTASATPSLPDGRATTEGDASNSNVEMAEAQPGDTAIGVESALGGNLVVLAANAAVAGAYGSDADDVEELVTDAVAQLGSSPANVDQVARLESAPGHEDDDEPMTGALASLESSPAGDGEVLDDTVGLDEPPAAEAWIDEG